MKPHYTLLPSFLFALVLVALSAGSILAGDAQTMPDPNSVRTIVIIGNDSLKFSVNQIEAAPGQKLHIQLRNEGTMPKETMGHNWVLLDDDAEATPYALAALTDRAENYQPKSLASHVIACVPLLGPREVGDVTFQVPSKPGHYPYICSCSGHSMAGMRGELIVK